MLTKSPNLKKLVLSTRDNLMNIAVFTTIILIPLAFPVALVLGLSIVYFMFAQFRELWGYKTLRALGFHCFFLQFSEMVVSRTEIGKQLLTQRDAYQHDYIDMGYNMFNIHAGELIQLDIRFRRLQEADDILEPYFN